MAELDAITRKEKFLAKAAGQDVEVPEPITREEMFLSKIAGGGGGGGGTKVIDLNAFGIDIVTPALQGGGTISFDINHKEFWESIPIYEPFVFMAYTGQAYISCQPLGTTVVDDKVTNVDFMMVVTYGGALMRGTVKFDTSISYSRTTAYINIETLTIPS